MISDSMFIMILISLNIKSINIKGFGVPPAPPSDRQLLFFALPRHPAPPDSPARSAGGGRRGAVQVDLMRFFGVFSLNLIDGFFWGFQSEEL
jgi:hypothetical protein